MVAVGLATRKRPYWLCRYCGHRNERLGTSRKCQGCGSATARRLKRAPKHSHPLRQGRAAFEMLNMTVHKCNPDHCAICGKRLDKPGSGQRDHAHFDGGYARGLLCWYCNKTLGQVERGKDGEEWMRSALDYVRRAREHHAGLV